jgi:hypothetical protein
MRQKNVFRSERKRSLKMRASCDSCFRRHLLPRKFQEEFPSKDTSSSFGSFAMREERRLQNQVAILLSKGCKLLSTETLEEFVERNKEILEDVI